MIDTGIIDIRVEYEVACEVLCEIDETNYRYREILEFIRYLEHEYPWLREE